MHAKTLCRLLLVLAAPLLLSCSGLEFDVSRELPEQRLEGNVLSEVLEGIFENPITFDVNVQAETAARDTGPAQSAHMQSLTLRITETAETEGDEDNFNFLETVDIYIESAEQDSSLPRKKIAELPEITPDQKRLEFITDQSVNLLPYANEGAVITSEASGSPPPDEVSFAGSYTIRIIVL